PWGSPCGGFLMTAPQQSPGDAPTVAVHCAPSATLAPLLERLGTSVVLTAPHSGHLIVLAAPEGKLSISFHTFERVMGVAVARAAPAVCTRTEVWLVRNAPDIAAKIEPRGRFDACYQARASYFTGDLQGHEAAWVGGEVWLVNTAFSCLCS